MKESKKLSILAHGVLLFFTASAVFPFLLLIIASFTDNRWATANGFTLFPGKWSLEAYEYIARQWATIGHAYAMTFIVTIIGTAGSLLVTALFAYALSHTEYPGIKLMNFMCVFTMLFSGGIVATYYCWVNIFHVRDTLAALIFPNLFMTAFNVMLVRNYFRNSIPLSLIEAARIDGAGETKIFFQIVMPLSLPILATIGLLVGISYWNDWTNGLYYLTDRKGSDLFTIQIVLNKINENLNFLLKNASSLGITNLSGLPTTTARMAIAVVGILPVLAIYPFFQKYFVKGITLGGVKE